MDHNLTIVFKIFGHYNFLSKYLFYHSICESESNNDSNNDSNSKSESEDDYSGQKKMTYKLYYV